MGVSVAICVSIGDWKHTVKWPAETYAEAIQELKSSLKEGTVITDRIDDATAMLLKHDLRVKK